MITEKDLRAAIAECEGERNPNANTCMKLAAFYTIKNQLYPEDPQKLAESTQDFNGYSYGASPQSGSESLVNPLSDTEFAESVRGMPQDLFFGLVDELMSTLAVVQPRLYASVMRKTKSLVP